jgi:hypothetical protein
MKSSLYICGEIVGIDPPMTKSHQASFSPFFCLVLLNSLVMKLIKLTQGKFAMVDDEDYEYLNQFRWHAHKMRNTYYAEKNGKQINNVREKPDSMHYIIMNTPKELQVDHWDRNGLNNQKSNLRICTHSQNQSNRKSSGRSKYLGVSFSEYGRVRATIRLYGKTKHLGYFEFNEEAAARAYDEAAKKYHGTFANLNFPENVE